MKTSLLIIMLCVACARPVFARLPLYRSAEQSLRQASDLETWQQQLRYYEQQLTEREQTVFGKLETQQQEHQQHLHQAAEREALLRRTLQQQQEQARQQDFQMQLRRQQQDAQQRETELQRRLEEEREDAAYARLQQMMDSARIQDQIAEELRHEQSSAANSQENAYGYADKFSPSAVDVTESSSPPPVGGVRGGGGVWSEISEHADKFSPPPNLPHQGGRTHIGIVLPPPVATVAPLESRISTTLNGIDRIETRALLPLSLSVEQLEAAKQIAENGVLIAQQRLGLEQFQLGSESQVSRLRVFRGFVLWGLLLSIPTLVTLSWIARRIVLGWRNWRREQLVYKLRELEHVEEL